MPECDCRRPSTPDGIYHESTCALRLAERGVPYDRAVLVDVLVYHWRTDTSGCGCGWAELGKSHPEHVADVYEQSVAASGDADERGSA